MNIKTEILRDKRSELNRRFILLATREDIDLEYNEDIKTLDVCDRLFDATIGERRINIDYNPSSQLTIDGFVKDFESEIGAAALLTISVNDVGLDAERLWGLYKGWLQEGISPEAALEALAR